MRFQPVELALLDHEGCLVFDDEGHLVAVLSRLGSIHGELAGAWHLETLFGRSGATATGQIFSTLGEAGSSLAARTAPPA